MSDYISKTIHRCELSKDDISWVSEMIKKSEVRIEIAKWFNTIGKKGYRPIPESLKKSFIVSSEIQTSLDDMTLGSYIMGISMDIHSKVIQDLIEYMFSLGYVERDQATVENLNDI